LFSGVSIKAQSRTCYVLIKKVKAPSFSCIDQDKEYIIQHINNKLDYKKKQKLLNVFKNRLKAGDKKNSIKQEAVTMDQNDFLVVYEFLYKYSDTVNEKCKTNIGRILKGFTISDLADLDKKMSQSLANAWLKDKYISHKILEIQQPFYNAKPGLVNTLSFKIKSYLKKHNDSVKKRNKDSSLGSRG
jgi:hypothetical protein